MRHLEIYQYYMINTPTEIRSLVIRQTNNLFLFNLTEAEDIRHIESVAKIGSETIQQIAKAFHLTDFLFYVKVQIIIFFIRTKPLPCANCWKNLLIFNER